MTSQRAELRAKEKVKRLWQHGDLFHVASRYPRNPNAPRIDRLGGNSATRTAGAGAV
jgi:hypothetical protein